MGTRPPLELFPVWNGDHPTQPPYFSIHEAATLEITLACSLNVISNEPFSTLLVLGCPYSSFAKTEVWGHCTWLPTWTCHEDDPEPSWYVVAVHFPKGCSCPVSGEAQVDALLLFLGGKAANDDQDSKAGISDSPLAREWILECLKAVGGPGVLLCPLHHSGWHHWSLTGTIRPPPPQPGHAWIS